LILVNSTLTALAEPNRYRIVDLLRKGPRPVGEIVEELGLQQPQVSKHLRVLSDAGLVTVHPVAQQRFYELRPEPFNELAAWLESYREALAARHDRLDVLLHKLQEKERNDGRAE
jgi:DNA-binding transcriptional ArsR family regulator